ncbi:hypothetical protein VUJ46_15600 [Chryseobacterium sp. MYb264]|uniref:hypothetical protein n=1 Tax=Chryseobacterium sp. MYb264 TaxID=2745153 RepID=UPI002E0DB6A9|nr:hypothetical protein VUJ46_15600 [Chryseobacterium sp. MYb264]
MNSLFENDLVRTLKVIGEDSNYQKKHIANLLGENCDNVDEILLEYDDYKYLKQNYNDCVNNLFTDLENILDEIDNLGLHSFSDLNDDVWNKARNIANEILKIVTKATH